jgi:hypothetical protein
MVKIYIWAAPSNGGEHASLTDYDPLGMLPSFLPHALPRIYGTTTKLSGNRGISVVSH